MYGIILVSLIISGFIIGKTTHKFIKNNKIIIFTKAVRLLQSISIFILLIMMGYKIGSNQELVSRFSTIGFHSLLFGISTLLGSSLVTWLLISIANKIHFKKKNKKINSHVPFSVEGESPSRTKNIIMIFVFIGLVAVGGMLGYFKAIEITNNILTGIVDASLYCLVFFIGIDMGLSQLTLDHLLSIGKSTIFICLGVILGSLSGAIILGLLLKYDFLFSLSVGIPMGWYSLGGIMLSKVSEELGAMAFTANLIRELFAMAFVPLIGTLMSKESAIAACGATAMDTTLPAITKGLGRQYAVTGFTCGIIISSIVPILLPIIQSVYGII